MERRTVSGRFAVEVELFLFPNPNDQPTPERSFAGRPTSTP